MITPFQRVACYHPGDWSCVVGSCTLKSESIVLGHWHVLDGMERRYGYTENAEMKNIILLSWHLERMLHKTEEEGIFLSSPLSLPIFQWRSASSMLAVCQNHCIAFAPLSGLTVRI